jgi:hypothetical protein
MKDKEKTCNVRQHSIDVWISPVLSHRFSTKANISCRSSLDQLLAPRTAATSVRLASTDSFWPPLCLPHVFLT